MRFLISLRDRERSMQTLHFAALLASRLSTDITVLYVAAGVRMSFSTEAEACKKKMSEWSLESPGNEVLLAAREHLASMGLIRATGERDGYHEVKVSSSGSAYELQQIGSEGENVSFRYREGDSLEQILEELRSKRYDLLVIGAGMGKSELVAGLLKFSPSSVLLVKNPQDIRYRILVATDATPPAHRAELLAIKTASFLGMEITFLSIIKDHDAREFMEKHLERMTRLCEMKNVSYNVKMIEGSVVEETTAAAGEDHIIFLGSSRRGTLKKFFLGSKTISIAERASCPMMVVK